MTTREFRGYNVAAKKLKCFCVSSDVYDQFDLEFEMLDRFRCDLIVLYGACFIPKHKMMVAEFAPCVADGLHPEA